MRVEIDRLTEALERVEWNYRRGFLSPGAGVKTVLEAAREHVSCGDRLDEHDQALYSEAFILAEAVRRFLARKSTQRMVDGGLLDRDVVEALVESADRMWSIRTQRVGAAREAADE